MKRPLARVLVALVACWALAVLGPLSYLVIPGVLVALWRAWRRHAWVAVGLLLALNPVSGFFAVGVAAYLGGAPVLRSRALPGLESSNPDPASRCFRGGGTDFPSGGDWLTLATPNAAMVLLCRCFGPPAQAYDGPYPTRDEALAWVGNALLTPVDQFLKGRVLADGTMVKLQPAVVSGLAGLVDLKDDTSTPARARIYQNRCVILRLSRMPSASEPADGFAADVLVLLDKANQRPFAYYPLKGKTLPRVPPVTYLD